MMSARNAKIYAKVLAEKAVDRTKGIRHLLDIRADLIAMAEHEHEHPEQIDPVAVACMQASVVCEIAIELSQLNRTLEFIVEQTLNHIAEGTDDAE
jgi:hypothetical protein